MAKLLITI